MTRNKFFFTFIVFLSFYFLVLASDMVFAMDQQSKLSQQEIQKRTIIAAKAVYQQINKNWTYLPAEESFTPSTESSYWTPKWISTHTISNEKTAKANALTLVLNDPIENLSEALKDLVSKPAVLECTTALMTVKAYVLLALLGQEKFNAYAKAFYNGMIQQNWSLDEFFFELPRQFLKSEEMPSPLSGSSTYILNISLYNVFKPHGNGIGSNLFCVGNDLYVGFSKMYQDDPKSLEDVEKQDYTLFCQKDDLSREKDEHTKLIKSWTNGFQDFQTLRRSEQTEYPCETFDEELLNDYLQTGTIYF